LTAYVLAGGQGTRLAALYPDLPKSLVPVAGRAFLDHQLAWLAAHGLTDVVLCAGHRGEALAAHVGDGRAFGVRVRVVVEDRPRGTAGALAGAIRALGESRTFFAVNGDTWAEFDPERLESAHRRLAAAATVACYRVPDASGRGVVEPEGAAGTAAPGGTAAPAGEAAPGGMAASGGQAVRLSGFREKAAAGPAWVSGGIYLLEPDALASVDEEAASLECDVFPRLVAIGRTVAGVLFEGRFWDMGTPAGRAEAEAALAGASEERG